MYSYVFIWIHMYLHVSQNIWICMNTYTCIWMSGGTHTSLENIHLLYPYVFIPYKYILIHSPYVSKCIHTVMGHTPRLKTSTCCIHMYSYGINTYGHRARMYPCVFIQWWAIHLSWKDPPVIFSMRVCVRVKIVMFMRIFIEIHTNTYVYMWIHMNIYKLTWTLVSAHQ